jgi:Tfp pilus assembly protein PilX
MLQMRKPLQDETGFASIVIALILIIILGLFCVGFAQLARHEQQSALSKQLANQAYDAAETGVNDAFQDIQNNQITTANASDTSCMQVAQIPNSAVTHYPNIDKNHDIAYTCLMVNLDPLSLHYQVPNSQSVLIPFSTHAKLNSLVVDWGSLNGHFNQPPSTSYGFPPASTWDSQGYRGVLQVGLTPLGNGTGLSRQGLINNSFTTIGYGATSGATTGANQVAYTSDTPNSQGSITPADCSDGIDCSIVITNLQNAPGSGPGNYYYLLHVTSLYDDSGIAISGTGGVSNTRLNFYNSQALIDVTGKARYVVKRLQVYVPISQESSLPQAALEGQNICKQFTTDPITGTNGYPVTESC